VTVVAKPGWGRNAEAALGPSVEVVELPLDEVWLRDYGPLFVEDGGGLVAVDFGFDVWGARKRPYPEDGVLGRHLAEWLGIRREVAPLVIEGGAVTSDGRGTLIAVESSVIDEARNPGIGRDEVEETLARFLGADRVIWLPYGIVEDDPKRGHVDNVARFVGPGRVLSAVARDDPNRGRLDTNRRVLQRAGLELVDVEITAFEANFYIGNSCVIVPVARPDPPMLAVLAELFPDREIVPIPGTNLARCAGGIHCITLEQPSLGE
jgi:agmatine deiminase